MRPPIFALSAALALSVAACGADHTAAVSQATTIGRAIVAACPMAAPDSVAARAACADALTNLAVLRDAMAEPFLWGQQTGPHLYDFDLSAANTTRFNPLAWRRMYLSLFMFTGSVTVDQEGERTILRLPYVFRNGLDPGEYPYPFWHNPTKWRDYQLATELVLVFRGGRMVGALRSAVRLLTRPQTVRTWDGQWTWADGGEPHVSLYRNLFRAGNPQVARLETAYRALEDAMRPYACIGCHSPDNVGHANPLELFSFPNQALVARHAIRVQIAQGTMPPANTVIPAGITDPGERAALLRLATEFESAADDALAAEHEAPQPDIDAGM